MQEKMNGPLRRRILCRAPINGHRPRLIVTLRPDGEEVWNKYTKRPEFITRQEIEAFWAWCDAWFANNDTNEERFSP